MSSTIPKIRLCALCESTVAIENSALCHACNEDVERDNQIPNFEYCNVCSGELNRRGYCGECLDGWSGAQVRDVIAS